MADLANPSTLVIQETSPSRFTVELTLPVINGRIVKAKPILPDICVVDGEPEVRGDAMQGDPNVDHDLRSGAAGGRARGHPRPPRHGAGRAPDRRDAGWPAARQQLRATQAFFVIPPPPTLAELALERRPPRGRAPCCSDRRWRC